jgi:hypothetical protein
MSKRSSFDRLFFLLHFQVPANDCPDLITLKPVIVPRETTRYFHAGADFFCPCSNRSLTRVLTQSKHLSAKNSSAGLPLIGKTQEWQRDPLPYQ